MKFYEALKLVDNIKIENGTSVYFMVNDNWNGLKTNKKMSVFINNSQETYEYNKCPFLEMVIEQNDGVDIIPWIPSFLDILSDKWKVFQYNKQTELDDEIMIENDELECAIDGDALCINRKDFVNSSAERTFEIPSCVLAYSS